jgi:predicted nucleic acid-binding protein
MQKNKEFEVIISDSSTLIALNLINDLDLLKKMYGKITITKDVDQEFHHDKPDWIEVKEVTNRQEIERIKREKRIHTGESSSIVLAEGTKKHLLILDDGNARDYAFEIGLNVKGLVGVIFDSFDKGIKNIDQLNKTFVDLKKTKFHLSDDLWIRINRLINEKTIKPLSCINEFNIENGNLSKKYSNLSIANIQDVTGQFKHSDFGKAEKVIYINNKNSKLFTLEIKEPYDYNKYKNHIFQTDRDFTLIEAKIFFKQYLKFKNNIKNNHNKNNIDINNCGRK